MKYLLLFLSLFYCSCSSSNNPPELKRFDLIFFQDAYAWLDGGTKTFKIITVKSESGRKKVSSTTFRITSKFEKKQLPNELYLETFNGNYGLNRKATVDELNEIKLLLTEIDSRYDEIEAINQYINYLKINLTMDPSQQEFKKLFNNVEEKFMPVSSQRSKLYVYTALEFINKKLIETP